MTETINRFYFLAANSQNFLVLTFLSNVNKLVFFVKDGNLIIFFSAIFMMKSIIKKYSVFLFSLFIFIINIINYY